MRRPDDPKWRDADFGDGLPSTQKSSQLEEEQQAIPVLDDDQEEATRRDLDGPGGGPDHEDPTNVVGPSEEVEDETKTNALESLPNLGPPREDFEDETKTNALESLPNIGPPSEEIDDETKTDALETLPTDRRPLGESDSEPPNASQPPSDGPEVEDRTLPLTQAGALGSIGGGRYLLSRQIGRGAMGVVYEAFDQAAQRIVALKVLSADQLNTEVVDRFVIEARVAASIVHENVGQLFDLGVDPKSRCPYMAMELLRGKDLETMQRGRGALPIDEACHYLAQVCRALGAAHRMGVVHRDVKPSNIYVLDGPEKRVKVLDFGVSKAPGFGDVTIVTQSGAMLGSPMYMSPEQIRNPSGVDGRADIWSVGVVLYELLAGRPPFDGHSMIDLFEKILNTNCVPLRAHRPDLPKILEQVVTVTLEKDRERRYASIDTLEKMLQTFATPAQVMVRRS